MKKLVLTAPTSETFRAELGALPQLRLEDHSRSQQPIFLEAVRDAHFLLVASATRVDGPLLDQAPRLQLVLTASAGSDHLDTAELERRGIRWATAAAANADAVGEHALGLLLALLRHLPRADYEVRQRTWRRDANRGTELWGRTVGLIGYGATARAFARRLSGFGCRVLAYDKYLSAYADGFAQEATLPRLQAEAEIVSFHVPLTQETRGWLKDGFLAAFRRPVWLLNTARGPITPARAVLEGLANGRLRGAALDVLENESLDQLSPEEAEAFEALAAHEAVVLSPHIAGRTDAAAERIEAMLLAVLRDALGA